MDLLHGLDTTKHLGQVVQTNKHSITLDAYYASGITNGNAGGYPMGTVPTSNGQYSKMSFMHDYVLGEFGAQERIVDTLPNGKVRMAFCHILYLLLTL